jgi:hypothetical protein
MTHKTKVAAVADDMIAYHMQNGRKLGYPLCCQEYFLERLATFLSGERPEAFDGEPWDGTGFVPCATCRARIKASSLEQFVSEEIAPRRARALPPFPGY